VPTPAFVEDNPITVTPSQIAIVWWPEDAAGVDRLRAAGIPRLLLVAPDAAPPVGTYLDEDWMRRPALDDEVRARMAALAARSVPPDAPMPTVSTGRIHYRGRWVSVSETEQAVAGVLADRFGDIVELPALRSAGGLSLTDGGVRVYLTRLRKRIKPIGLVIRAVRNRGYVLDDQHRSPVGA
jgi:hypothetical protein